MLWHDWLVSTKKQLRFNHMGQVCEEGAVIDHVTLMGLMKNNVRRMKLFRIAWDSRSEMLVLGDQSVISQVLWMFGPSHNKTTTIDEPKKMKMSLISGVLVDIVFVLCVIIRCLAKTGDRWCVWNCKTLSSSTANPGYDDTPAPFASFILFFCCFAYILLWICWFY